MPACSATSFSSVAPRDQGRRWHSGRYCRTVTYSWAFLAVALVVVLTPGADFAVIVRNTVAGGRRVGTATTAGVGAAATLQGLLASLGLAGFIVRAHPVFTAITWAGIAYLGYLAAGALLSVVRGRYQTSAASRRPRSRASGFRQGFLCNATNPKILVFYLALLPQFVGSGAPWWDWLAHAWTLPLLGTCCCLIIVVGFDRARDVLNRRAVRRALDALTGTVLLAFCVRLATEA